ncbi:hypothetical protein [Bradyrhizobium sp. AZCC 2289]|uniref:hypothetical protein n=1 Tax=Bradyrhizobium sp. AZCC 2289 TaxID=3117026 RepID=UPI002FF32244
MTKPAIDYTERNNKILALLAEGLSKTAIGEMVGISRTRVASIKNEHEREQRIVEARKRVGAKLRADF